jgi:hypothetical protein
MKKPAPKTEVTINSVHHHVRMIFFDATADAASDFAEFGTLSSPEKTSSGYLLFVNGRFDFDEVVQYIENYAKQQEAPPEWLEDEE